MIPEVQIAPFMKYREVVCPCCEQGPMHVRLLTAWTALREALGEPLRVLSGYRCQEYNKTIGGSPTSKHMTGLALDVTSDRVAMGTPLALRLFLQCGFKGIGRGKGMVHLDVRDRHTFWKYMDDGSTEGDWDAMEVYQSMMR